MNPIPDFSVGASDALALDALLAPLSPDAPCGPAARNDAVFTEIRLLREEDDPTLPMGQWERPLKCADWTQIERRCTDMLTTRSKDLQIAAWLAESWMRQRGFDGLLQGLRLLDALLRRYWSPLHPVIDDGDCDARLAPLEWLNESLSGSVRVHAVLVSLDLGKAIPLTLADWDSMTAHDIAVEARGERKRPDGTTALTRADIVAAAWQKRPELTLTGAAVRHSLDCLHSLVALLDQQLTEGPPKLSKLQNVLEAVQRVLAQLQPEGNADKMTNDQAAGGGHAGDDDADVGGALPSGDPVMAASAIDIAIWRNRGEAYATLEALADYLSHVEPHSPTPFLIRRAVNWGRMSLPEVIAEIIREDGDLNGLLNVLGIRS